MIGTELKETFSNLNTIEKRNQISNELIAIGSLIEMKEKSLNIPADIKIKNHDVNSQDNFTEDKMLDFLYEDIYSIKRELLTLLSIVNNSLN